MTQQPNYHPIENVWLISQAIKGSVTQARDLTKVLKEAEHQPYVLDDAIINGESLKFGANFPRKRFNPFVIS